MKRLILFFWAMVLLSCSEHELWPNTRHDEVGVAVAPVSIAGNTTAANAVVPPAPVNQGAANIIGVAVPSAEAVIGRLANGLEGNAPQSMGNFATAIRQLRTNLPKTTNVNSAAGYDQIQLLVYAACSDLTTGSPSIMQSKYGIDPAGTVAAQNAALLAAGMRILDQHTAGIATQGVNAGNLQAALQPYITSENANSPTMVFMMVCIAANTAGIAMLGM